MNQQQLFDALQKRSSIRVARRVLALNDFPRGSGWDQIVEKLKDKTVAAKADFKGLEDGLRQLLIAEDKGLRVYELSASAAATLRSKIGSVTIPQSGTFASYFPQPVPESILNGMPPQSASPVAKFETNLAFGALFSSINIVEIREKLTPSQVGAAGSNYDEIIGIKKVKSQTFDTFIVSKNQNYAYALTDAHLDTTNSTKRGLHYNMKQAVNQLCGINALDKTINLLPLVEPLYNSADGAVKRLNYTTTTSSGKQEWMRGSGNCLREELSHKAGMQALSGGFKAYGIEIEYPLEKVKGGYIPRPLLAVVGSYRMTYELNPSIEDATVWGCSNIEELEGAVAEMMSHVIGTKTL